MSRPDLDLFDQVAQRALYAALVKNDRWSPPAIAAALSIDAELSTERWVATLDKLETAIGEVVQAVQREAMS